MSTFSLPRLAPKHVVTTPPGYAERACVLAHYALPGLPHCYALCHEPVEALPAERQSQLLAFFIAEAERLSLAATGEREAYVLVHNGAGIAKRANWHAHVFVVRERWQKAWIHLIIGVKNVLRALAPAPGRERRATPSPSGPAPTGVIREASGGRHFRERAAEPARSAASPGRHPERH